MSGRRKSIRNFVRLVAFGAVASAILAGAGCPPPPGEFHILQGGSFENVGAVIEEPGVFRIVGGQPYTTPFAIDCTKLSADVNGWQAALAAGAHKVAITLPGQRRQYGGVLAFCTIHTSATGPSSRSYDLVIPESKIPEASDGLIASVAEQVTVNRMGAIDFSPLAQNLIAGAITGQGVGQSVGQTVAGGGGQPAAVTEDFAWMLWFTDRPEALGINFITSAPEPAPPSSLPPPPPLTKGATYTLSKALTLRAGPGQGAAVLGHLAVGDTVVAEGESKGSYWSVTTAGGQAGWVSARSLKPN